MALVLAKDRNDDPLEEEQFVVDTCMHILAGLPMPHSFEKVTSPSRSLLQDFDRAEEEGKIPFYDALRKYISIRPNLILP